MRRVRTAVVALMLVAASCGGSEAPPDVETLSRVIDQRCLGWAESLASYGAVPQEGGIETAAYLDEVKDVFLTRPELEGGYPRANEYEDPEEEAIADEWSDANGLLSSRLNNFKNHFDPAGSLEYSTEGLFIDYLEILRSVNVLTSIAQDVAGNDCSGLDGIRNTMAATAELFDNDWGQYSLTGDVAVDVSTACERHLSDLPRIDQFSSFGAEMVADAMAIRSGFSDLGADLSRITVEDPEIAENLEMLIASVETISRAAGSVSRGGSGTAAAAATQEAEAAIEAIGATC